MSAEDIQTVGDLIKRLGGPAKASPVLGKSPQNITNWQRAGAIPSKHFLVHQQALTAIGVTAPASLWGFAEARAAE